MAESAGETSNQEIPEEATQQLLSHLDTVFAQQQESQDLLFTSQEPNQFPYKVEKHTLSDGANADEPLYTITLDRSKRLTSATPTNKTTGIVRGKWTEYSYAVYKDHVVETLGQGEIMSLNGQILDKIGWQDTQTELPSSGIHNLLNQLQQSTPSPIVS